MVKRPVSRVRGQDRAAWAADRNEDSQEAKDMSKCPYVSYVKDCQYAKGYACLHETCPIYEAME